MQELNTVPALSVDAILADANRVLDPPKPELSEFDKYRVTAEKDIPRVDPVIKWDGHGIAAPGNITVESAASKAGKTAFKLNLVAGAISKTGITDIFESITVTPNPEGKAVIDLDTEQAEADQQDGLRTVLKRAHFDVTPDYYLAYNIRSLSLDNYQDKTNGICEAANEKFGGIHSIFIDGGADYLEDVNDAKTANAIVTYFIQLSIKYNCPVIIIVHLNPGSDKERGHFGSQLQRKCYSMITIEKKGDVSTAKPKFLRKAGLSDLNPISFQFNKDLGYHTQVSAPDPDKTAIEDKERKLGEIADQVFGSCKNLRHGEAVNEIMRLKGCGESTAKSSLKQMVAFRLVEKSGEFYRKGQEG